MKIRLTFALALVIILTTSVPVAAQITITIPKLPKIKKSETKPTPQPTPQQTSSEGSSVRADESIKTVTDPKAVSSNCSDDWWVKSITNDIAKTRAEAEEFVPGLRGYYVSELNDRKNLHLEAALYQGFRNDWFTGSKLDAKTIACMNPVLDDLAAVARKTLPGYTGPSDYTFGTPAEKKTLSLGAASDIANAKVLKVGMKPANWLIAKDDYNFPTARYKYGFVWAKYPNQEFCWVFWVNLKQDYAGGGTYGASYGQYLSRAVAGCPAGK